MGSFSDVTNGLKTAQNEVSDGFSDASNVLNGVVDFFNGSPTPSTLGYGTRQSKLNNNRLAFSNRNIIHWVVPEGPIIQMYVNPQSIQYSYQKDIQSVRTKGGYLVQYFGPQLPRLQIQGTTGTSGVEGINVLYDLYRYEQLAFDPYALYMSSEAYKKATVGNIFGPSGDNSASDTALSIGTVASTLLGQASTTTANMQPPSLADIAFRVEMFYSGEVYRGYFTDFSVTESADNMGMFNYSMTFIVTQKRGFRQNFFAWHRSANDGPSNSNPRDGVPYSYSALSSYPR
jgi:hypothetical protein